MPSVEVWIDPCDVLDNMDDDEIEAEYQARLKKKGLQVQDDSELLDRIAWEYRAGGATPSLREYIYRTTGKII